MWSRNIEFYPGMNEELEVNGSFSGWDSCTQLRGRIRPSVHAALPSR
jgi:hypothetical protein